MSHFSVLVIGPNIEDQLQPYHEFECTGINDQYIQDVDITAKVLEYLNETPEDGEPPRTLNDALEYHGLEDRCVHDKSEIDREGEHKFGYAIISNKSELVKAVDRTNPNAKWDWWVEGGRYSNRLTLKDGVKVNSAIKGDVDFESRKSEMEQRAAKEYDAVQAAIAGTPENEPWSAVRDRLGVEAAREEYKKQPRVVALSAFGWTPEGREIMSWDASPEDYAVPREQFLQAARDRAIATFAVVKDGKWFERGEMGWFACVSNEKDEVTWNREFSALVDGLPDDTLLTIVDCHI